MISTKSRKGRQRSSTSTLKSPPELLQKKEKSSASSNKRPSSLGLDDDILEVGYINNTSDRRTRNKQTYVKHEREDIRSGWRGCPECGAMELWQDACKTVECRKSHLHSTGRYVRWCIFCKKRCKEIELTVKCDCPGYNGPEERRIYHEQYQLPVDMINDDEDEAEEGRSRLVSDEGGTTTSPAGAESDDTSSSSLASSQGDDGSDKSYVMSGGSSEEEDSGDITSESTPPAVLPDKVKSNHTFTSVPLPDKVKSSKAAVKEEEESTDEEGHGEMGMHGKKKRIKVEPQALLKTEEVSTDDDEGLADMTSSLAATDKLKIKKEKYDMEVETAAGAVNKQPLLMCLDVGTNSFPSLNDSTDGRFDLVVARQENEAVSPSKRRSSHLPASAKKSNTKSQSVKKKRKAPPREVEESNAVEKAAHKLCSVDGCGRKAAGNGKCRTEHNGYDLCSHDGCTKAAQKGGVCCSHTESVIVQKAIRGICSVEGCGRTAKDSGKCRKHNGYSYCSHDGCTKAAHKGGVCKRHKKDPFAKVKEKTAHVECSVQGCTRKAAGNGRCSREHGGKNICSQEGCTKQAKKGGVCTRHKRIHLQK